MTPLLPSNYRLYAAYKKICKTQLVLSIIIEIYEKYHKYADYFIAKFLNSILK